MNTDEIQTPTSIYINSKIEITVRIWTKLIIIYLHVFAIIKITQNMLKEPNFHIHQLQKQEDICGNAQNNKQVRYTNDLFSISRLRFLFGYQYPFAAQNNLINMTLKF